MPGQIMYKGDRKPDFVVCLQDMQGKPFKLTDTDITGVTLTIGIPGSTPIVNNVAMTVVDAEAGKVSYGWAAGDTATPGTYSVFIRVNYTGGKFLTIGDITLDVRDTL